MCGPSIIPIEPRELGHPKPSWVWHGVKIIRIRLSVHPGMPLWGETELPEGSCDLFPNSLHHLSIWSHVRHIRSWGSREQHVTYLPLN
jgi:hypothetical protein